MIVSFDCYGTLIDWIAGMRGTLRTLLAVHPHVDPPDDFIADYILAEMEVERGDWLPYREVMARTLGKIFQRRGITLKEPERQVFSKTLPWWSPFPDARPALEALRARGHRLAILSNIDRDLMAESVKRIGVAFDHVVTAEDVKSYKPAKAHWTRLMEVSGAARGEIVHVSTSRVHDIVPAVEMGFRCVWVQRGARTEGALPAGVRTVNTLEDLPEVVGE